MNLKTQLVSHIISGIVTFCAAMFIMLSPVQTTEAATTIMDNANLLTESEVRTLTDSCEQILDKYQTSVYIWTDSSIGKSDNYDSYMESIISAQTNQTDENNIVILLIGMKPNDRIYQIHGYGKGGRFLTNRRCNLILDDMYDDMHAGNYYQAANTFVRQTGDYLKRDPRFDTIPFSSLSQIIFCLILAACIIFALAYRSRGGSAAGSRTYLEQNSSKIPGRFERYTHTTTTRTVIPKSSSSGSGGGSSHSKGSGRSF